MKFSKYDYFFAFAFVCCLAVILSVTLFSSDSKSTPTKSKTMSVAILLCGQMRDFEKCVETIKTRLLAFLPDYDIYCVTQDSNSKKSYSSESRKNQYLHSYNAPRDIEKSLNSHFGKHMKSVTVEETFWKNIENQDENFVQKNDVEYLDKFQSVKKAFDQAVNSGKTYDVFIKIRPDLFFIRDFKLSSVKNNSKQIIAIQSYGNKNLSDIFFASNRLGMESITSAGVSLEKATRKNNILEHDACVVFQWIIEGIFNKTSKYTKKDETYNKETKRITKDQYFKSVFLL